MLNHMQQNFILENFILKDFISFDFFYFFILFYFFSFFFLFQLLENHPKKIFYFFSFSSKPNTFIKKKISSFTHCKTLEKKNFLHIIFFSYVLITKHTITQSHNIHNNQHVIHPITHKTQQFIKVHKECVI